MARVAAAYVTSSWPAMLVADNLTNRSMFLCVLYIICGNSQLEAMHAWTYFLVRKNRNPYIFTKIIFSTKNLSHIFLILDN